jgi:hypothetical protein
MTQCQWNALLYLQKAQKFQVFSFNAISSFLAIFSIGFKNRNKIYKI